MELIQEKVSYFDTSARKTINYDEITDAIVPDSLPDILRIVNTAGSVVVKEETYQKDRVLISGTVKAAVVYMPEAEDEAKLLEVPVNFTHMEETKNRDENTVSYARCKLLGIDVRAVNSRKISVIASLQVEYNWAEPKELEISSGIYDDTYLYEVLAEEKKLRLLSDIAVKPFGILEDVSDNFADGKIIGASAVMKTVETKTVPGKLILKGEAKIKNTLLDSVGNFHFKENMVPFTQILDIQSEHENDAVSISYHIKGVECEKKDEGTAAVCVNGDIVVKTYREQAVTCIQDLYQTDYEIDWESETVGIACEYPAEHSTIVFSEEASAGMRMTDILEAHCVCESVGKNGACVMIAKMLFTSDDGRTYSVTRKINHQFDVAEGMQLRNVTVDNAAAVPRGDSAELKITAVLDWVECGERLVLNIKSAVLNLEKPKAAFAPVGLILRYPKSGESLWSIAKEYSTTMDAIKEANAMDGAALKENEMLLIPVR